MDQPVFKSESHGRQRIFISYSRQPPENAQFVRNLAGRLKTIGFSVWLDEEQIPPAGDIQAHLQKAIAESDVGLFVLTKGWLERDYTQFEVLSFGERTESRRLAIKREPITLTAMGAQLARYRWIDWLPDDPEPHARLWEVYCGVTDTAPGERNLWSDRGQELTPFQRSASSPPAPKPAPNPKQGRTPLSFAGRPIQLVVGISWSYLGSDLNEWIGIDPHHELIDGLPRLSDHAVAHIGRNDTLRIGTYESLAVRLEQTGWEYYQQEAPILCFCETRHGILAGTAAAGVVTAERTPPSVLLRLRDPVIEMLAVDTGVVTLGSRGEFGRAQPAEEGRWSFRWIDPKTLGRPLGLFPGFEKHIFGAYSDQGIGMVDSDPQAVTVSPIRFEESIRIVRYVGPFQWPYAVLSEAGKIFFLDSALVKQRQIRLPGGPRVLDFAVAQTLTGILAWTEDGRLFAISERRLEEVARESVCFAYPDSLRPSSITVVRYDRESGTSIEGVNIDGID